MAYEYLVDITQLKKPLDAPELLRELENKGFKPIAVTVDNGRGQIMVYFDNPLDDSVKKKLDAAIATYTKQLTKQK